MNQEIQREILAEQRATNRHLERIIEILQCNMSTPEKLQAAIEAFNAFNELRPRAGGGPL